jgi:hypothetical protein
MNAPPSCHRTRACVSLLRKFPVVIVAAALLGDSAVAQNARPTKQEVVGKLYQCKPGPWGDLQYYHAYVEMPDGIVELIARPEAQPKWIFPGGTEAKLRALFDTAGLPDPLQEYLLDPEHRQLGDNVLTVFPPAPDLISMTREQRTVIYRELARSELNVYHANPMFIANGDPDAWFARSKMRPELLEAVKKMTYLRGEVLCFSDLSVLLGMVKSASEAHDVLKAMSRTSTLMLRLKVRARSDLSQMVHYWSANNRNKDAERILHLSAQTEGIEQLDCIHLLPSLPRRCLHEYFSGQLSIFGKLPNCHWTSLNVFNFTPLDYHLDPRLVALHLNVDYTRVAPPYSFGDVLTFMTPSGDLLHSCVYIADDIVYTRNGQNMGTPWVLNKLEYVRRLYSNQEHSSVQGFRLKPPQGQVGN